MVPRGAGPTLAKGNHMRLDIRWTRFLAVWLVTFTVMIIGGAWMRGSDTLTGGSEFWTGLSDTWGLIGTSLWNIGAVIWLIAMLIWLDKALEADVRGNKKLKTTFMVTFFILIALLLLIASKLASVGLSEAALIFFGLPALVALAFSLGKRTVTSTS